MAKNLYIIQHVKLNEQMATNYTPTGNTESRPSFDGTLGFG